MIIAALDTGMRRGEMLALRFADIDLERGLIVLRGATTESGRTRLVPIATERLRAVLEWLRPDAAGERKRAETRVFSNEIGEAVGSFRTAWVNTVLEAHDVEVKWVKGTGWRSVAAECHEAFRKIDLYFHDTRHEYASRLVERGVPLVQVRDLLEQRPWRRSRPRSCQVFVRIVDRDPSQRHTDASPKIDATGLKGKDVSSWLGVRDDFRHWLIRAA